MLQSAHDTAFGTDQERSAQSGQIYVDSAAFIGSPLLLDARTNGYSETTVTYTVETGINLQLFILKPLCTQAFNHAAFAGKYVAFVPGTGGSAQKVSQSCLVCCLYVC